MTIVTFFFVVMSLVWKSIYFMRLFSLAFLSIFLVTTGWETDFDKAQKRAREEHKMILLNFSGSDWCIPCIRLHKELLETAAFHQYADSSLVLLEADFPRLKKNQLSKEQQKKNDALADKYNPMGSFPLTMILDEDGRVIKTWEGFIDLPPGQFISTITSISRDPD